MNQDIVTSMQKFFKLSSECKILLEASKSLLDLSAPINKDEDRKQGGRIRYLLKEVCCPQEELTGPNPDKRWFKDWSCGHERHRNKWYGWESSRLNVWG